MRAPLSATIPALVAALAASAAACPFCTTESRTLTEELADCECAVLARLVKPAAAETLGLNDKPEDGVPFGVVDPETGGATFRVESVLLTRRDALAPEAGETVEAIYFGDPDFETTFLLRGFDNPLDWSGAIPLKLSPVAVDYVGRLSTLPESGADRLAFFQRFFEHEDKLLAQDAYDEFARAPYADVKALRDRMDREQLLAWIESPAISPNRRRLYLTMLGVCGGPADAERVERLLLSDTRALAPSAEAAAAIGLAAGGPLSLSLTPESIRLDGRREKLGLDAMVACYLVLRGGDGLDLIEDRFLEDPEVDYSHVYSTLMAIRFLAEESDLIPRERLLRSARLLLDNRDFADQVIPDLARWEDWSVLDRLVRMFKGTVSVEGRPPEFEKYVRDPIVTYLDVAATQEGELATRANAALAELEPIAPDAFKRARTLWKFGAIGRAFDKTPPAEREPPAGPSEPAVAASAPAEAPESEEAEREETSVEEATELEQGFVGEEPPAPADFAASQQARARSASGPPPVEETAAVVEPDAPAAVEKTIAANAPADPPTPIGGPAAADPPAAWLLVTAPLVAFVGCFGLFWAILHAGH